MNCTVQAGYSFALTVSRLAPKLYAKVNDMLNTIGGKWNTNRQAHVFTENPQSMIDELIANGEIFTFKDFEFFYTPPAVIPLVMAKAGIRPGMRAQRTRIHTRVGKRVQSPNSTTRATPSELCSTKP